MPSTAALAISEERSFLRRLVTGLSAAGGEVTAAASFKEAYRHLAEAQVVFYHATSLPDETIGKLAGVMRGDRHLVLLVPRPGIMDLIGPLSLGPVTSVLSVAAADPPTLAGVASRSFFGDVFGLERYLPHGVQVRSALIRTYHHKTVAMAALANFARQMSIRRKYLENIERVADELLMNALYDAPLVGAQLGIAPPDSPLGKDAVVLQYGSDGEVFGMGVSDYWGALQRDTLIEYVSRCLSSTQSMGQTEAGSGAGLGLYLASNSVSQLVFNVSPGVATEVVSLFNLRAPKLRLVHLAFNTERADASRIPTLAGRGDGQGRAARSMANGHRRSSTPLPLRVALIAAVVVLFAASGILLWNRRANRPSMGALAIRTHPPGADISVDGTSRGGSGGRGLVVVRLAPGRHTVVARKQGYRLPDPVEATVESGRRVPVVVRLVRIPAALKVLSIPPGATITLNGKPRGKTPQALRDLTPGAQLRIRVSLAGYLAVERSVRAPAPGVTDAQIFQLQLAPSWGVLSVTANVPVPHVSLDGRPLGVGLPLSDVRVAVGKHVMELRSRWPYLRHRVSFQVKEAGQHLRRVFSFGRVRPARRRLRVYWDGRYRQYEFFAPVGQHVFRVKDIKTKKVGRRRLVVRADRVTRVRD